MSSAHFIAEHVKPIGSSGIRRVFDLGATLKNPINLSIGQPDFPVPQSVKDAMIHAIQDDCNGYTVTRGLPALRDRISQQLKNEFDWTPDVFVTSGLSGGLLLALMACINPGDEVIFGDPYFVSYTHLVKLVGGVARPVSMYDDFHLSPERIESAITDKTKIIMVCAPGNPTGIVFRDDDVKAVTELARKHNLLIISDEIYNLLSYDGPPPSAVTYAPERTLLLRGFSKSYAMTGLRLGFAAGPDTLISEMAKLQQYTFVCAPQPVQYGGLAALDVDMSTEIEVYRNKRDLVCRELDGVFEYCRPSGGFYVFPKVPSRFADATEFVEQAVSQNVLIIPGEVFSQRDTHFRISYAASDDHIREGCRVLRDLAG